MSCIKYKNPNTQNQRVRNQTPKYLVTIQFAKHLLYSSEEVSTTPQAIARHGYWLLTGLEIPMRNLEHVSLWVFLNAYPREPFIGVSGEDFHVEQEHSRLYVLGLGFFCSYWITCAAFCGSFSLVFSVNWAQLRILTCNSPTLLL